jgi:transcriptional regulator with XRE-family HTH domain
MALALKTPTEHTLDLASRVRARRLERDLTQLGLAQRAGVSLPSLKRFERSGQIALVSLVRLAMALDAVADLDHLFAPAPLRSLSQLDDPPRVRRRGRRT